MVPTELGDDSWVASSQIAEDLASLIQEAVDSEPDGAATGVASTVA